MSLTSKNLRERMSEIRPRDLIYPGIILTFFVIVMIIFYFSTRFLTKNINDAFLGDTGSDTNTLNMTNYTLVAKKLGVSIEVRQDATLETSSTENADEVASTSPTQDLDVSTLTLNILNSTTKKGLAGNLAVALEAAGFAKATVGNTSKSYTSTSITINEKMASFGPTVLEEVKKIYPDTTITTTTSTSDFDVIIIIGGK